MIVYVPKSPEGELLFHHTIDDEVSAMFAVSNGDWNYMYARGCRIVRCDLKEVGDE